MNFSLAWLKRKKRWILRALVLNINSHTSSIILKRFSCCSMQVFKSRSSKSKPEPSSSNRSCHSSTSLSSSSFRLAAVPIDPSPPLNRLCRCLSCRSFNSRRMVLWVRRREVIASRANAGLRSGISGRARKLLACAFIRLFRACAIRRRCRDAPTCMQWSQLLAHKYGCSRARGCYQSHRIYACKLNNER